MKNIEIEHYNNEELWSDLNISKPNLERIEKIIEMIPKDVRSVADIGCGNGLFLNYLQKDSDIRSLIGVDFSEKAMKEVETRKKVGDIEEIPLKSHSYDMVSALEVLEHLNINEYKKAKRELSRVSKKYILVSVPFNEDLELEFFKCSECKTRFNTSHHKRSFTEDMMKELFKKNGFECIDIKYISRRNRYFLLSPLLQKYRKFKGVRKASGMICPVCGARGKGISVMQKKQSKRRNFCISPLFKKLWPKKYTYKWIAVLYEKVN